MSTTEWDSRCRRCGRCCYEKIEFEGRVYYSDVPCRYLDLATCQCTIFHDRHRIKPECAPLTPEILVRGILPADCPYVADIADYRSPVLVD